MLDATWPSLDPETRIRHALTGVEPWAELNDVAFPCWRINVDRVELPVPAVVRAVLVDVLGLQDWGRWEKTAWQVGFCFVGTHMVIADRKMGVSLDVWHPEEAEARALALRLLAALAKAVAMYDKHLLLPEAQRRLRAGEVTIANKHHELRGAYDYFCEMVRECLAGQGRWQSDGRAARVIFPNQREAFINLVAAVQAWFSWLEHALVLVLPFAGYDPANDHLAEMIGNSWRRKYRRLFPAGHDFDADRVFGTLVALSERQRNTWAHGGFDKGGGLLHVHVPGVGAVPMDVTRHAANVHFPGIMGWGVDFEEVWSVLDDADRFLKDSSRTAHGLRYAEAGLQVRFDEASRAEYVGALVSDEAFERFLTDRAHAEDQVNNMDWW